MLKKKNNVQLLFSLKNLLISILRNLLIYFYLPLQLCPKDIADRVNLGLIPSSEPGWEAACRAIKKCSGGILHIHGNVETKKSTTKPSENLHGAHCKECSNGKPENDDRDSPKKVDGENIVRNMCSNNEATALNCSTEKNNATCLNCTNKRTLNKNSGRESWKDWSCEVSTRIRGILNRIHAPRQWRVNVLHVEHVKSYAPHVDHVVVDVDCRPILW